MREIVIRGWQVLRTCWLIIGVSLLFLLIAEGCVRVVRQITGADDTRPAVPEPYAASDWYPNFIQDYDAAVPQRWLSYLEFGHRPSFHGRYFNTNSLGHRVTPQPTLPEVPSARVFFFGGSTMFGTAQRDDHTIPAESSHRLQALVGPGARIEVTNFGETGYVFTQDVIDLVLQLRAGARPDVVVFYDGINDVFATVQAGVAGVPQNEAKRVAEFEMGRALDRTGFIRGTRRDLHAIALLAVAAFKQLALVSWLQSHVPKLAAPPLLPADSAARSTVRIYAEEARMVEALSQAYGFTAIYVWQPSIHGTQKKLTPYEERVMVAIREDRFHSRLQEVHRIIPAILGILGLSAYYHDSAACLLRDGEIVAAGAGGALHAQEGRRALSRHNAVEYCLREGGITAADLTLRRLLRQAAAQVRAHPRDLPRRRAARASARSSWPARSG